ncbi:iron-containing alcohol dehydrogenase family protein [Phascolarctobacterium sp.]|uniref:iron-containing alcohol dehydrogenase family protein n=1 Tax=Phascolarctobacterium sp. TaxID=2049039 RepID=UPI00386DEF5A
MMTDRIYYCDYTIGADAYSKVAAECSLFGNKALLIGGPKALAAGQKRLQEALVGSDLEIVAVETFSGECTYAGIAQFAALAKELGANMIFGMGGGKALDTAKGVGKDAGLPVFTFPTIAATCAGTTALSVVYHEDGSFDSFYYYDRPPRHCFMDLTIIANAPAIYLQAGMGDTMGKYFECHFAARGDKLAHSSALGREISNMCYFPLLEHGVQALADCRAHVPSDDLKEAVLANIVSTGLVSLMVLDCYNCAIAHSVYYALVLLPGFEEENLHGNVVAYGVLVQLAVDGKLEEARELKKFLQALEIRTTLKEMGAPIERNALTAVLKEAVSGPDMEHIPYPVSEDMLYDALVAVENL